MSGDLVEVLDSVGKISPISQKLLRKVEIIVAFLMGEWAFPKVGPVQESFPIRLPSLPGKCLE